jgi:predicted ATP-grasp superfamily ATP-dependent carboligase
VVIGANLRALGIARSLGRRGVATWLLHEPGDDPVARLSRYAGRTLPAPIGAAAQRCSALVDLAAAHGLRGWSLFATGDESALAVAGEQQRLADHFALLSAGRDAVAEVYSKRRTYALVQRIGLAHPRTWYPRTAAQVAALDCSFPAIVKPDVKASDNRFTRAKAWRVDDRGALLAGWRDAVSLVGSDATIVQELVPGPGQTQYSFAALCREGVAVAHLTARRTRQYPRDFGHSSSLVETVDEPRVEEQGRALIAALAWTGLIEVEFKRDPRDGRDLVLDINPRVWTWHSLGARAGVDFAYLAWRLSQGLPVTGSRAVLGVRWVRLATDLPSAWGALRAGELGPVEWAKSLRRPRQGALWAADDPVPAMVDPALVAWRTIWRGGTASERERVHRRRDPRDLLAGEARMHRQRDDPAGESFADRQTLPGGRGVGGRPVDRDRIVDSRTDLLRRQVRP